MSRFCGSYSPNHHPSTTVLTAGARSLCWCAVFGFLCLLQTSIFFCFPSEHGSTSPARCSGAAEQTCASMFFTGSRDVLLSAFPNKPYLAKHDSVVKNHFREASCWGLRWSARVFCSLNVAHSVLELNSLGPLVLRKCPPLLNAKLTLPWLMNCKNKCSFFWLCPSKNWIKTAQISTFRRFAITQLWLKLLNGTKCCKVQHNKTSVQFIK